MKPMGFDASDLYIVTGDSLNDVALSFRRLIGPSCIPTNWAFGAGQSHWSVQLIP